MKRSHSRQPSLRGEMIIYLAGAVLASGILTLAGSAWFAQKYFGAMVREQDVAVARAAGPELEGWYRERGSWAGLDGTQAQFLAGTRTALVLTDPDGNIIVDSFSDADEDGHEPPPSRIPVKAGQALVAEGRTVGYLFVGTMMTAAYNPRKAETLDTLRAVLAVSTSLQILFTAIFGWLVASRWLSPLSKIYGAVQGLRSGELEQSLDLEGPAELVRLGRYIEGLAEALSAQERSRQEFLADAAHELRTPVAVIQAHLEMLLDGYYEVTHDHLQRIYDETILLGHLIGELRDLSDLEAGLEARQTSVIPVAPILAETVEAMRPLFAERGRKVRLGAIPEALTAWIDPLRLGQVLRILLDNALKHGGEGTTEVDALAVPDGNPPRIRIAVSDEGPGVAPEELGKMFDRFYRADRSRQRQQGGRGLGLAIAQGIVRNAEGDIGAELLRPKGLRIWMELRASAPDA